MKSYTMIALSLSLAACATGKKTIPAAEPPPRVPMIDYFDIQNRLNLDFAPGETGFKEKKFDACYLGEALGELPEPLIDCHSAYFTLMQYQLSCRQDEQPEAVLTESDLRPVSNRQLKWTYGKITGVSQTNLDGEGVIRAISSGSQRRTHVRISTGVDYLMVRANEITAIVTGASWCK